jgi:hypothetical protein
LATSCHSSRCTAPGHGSVSLHLCLCFGGLGSFFRSPCRPRHESPDGCNSPSWGGVWLSPVVLGAFWGSPYSCAASAPWAPPSHLAVSCCSRCWRAVPLPVSGFADPRGSPLRSSRRGQVAAARVGSSAPPRVVRFRQPMPLVAHGCLPLRHPAALRPPTAAFAEGPGVLSSLVLSHLRGLYPCAPWQLTLAPPSSTADGPPASVTGKSGACCAFSGLLLVSVWGPMWAAPCVWPVVWPVMLSMSSLDVLWCCYLGDLM